MSGRISATRRSSVGWARLTCGGSAEGETVNLGAFAALARATAVEKQALASGLESRHRWRMSTETPRLASASGGLPSAVGWAHLLLADRLRPGAFVVDATAGNGHDTLFLAHLVGPTGHVLAFDVQAEALAATQARLEAAGIEPGRCTLVHAGHETLAEHLLVDWRGRVDAGVFNLGYLPGGDKTRITQAETTLAALAVAVDHLSPGGLLTVAVYPGHEGGREEQRAVAAWAESLPARAFEVQLLRPINRAATPPECWAVLKKG